MDRASQRMLAQRKDLDKLQENLIRFDGTNYDLYTLLDSYDTEILLFLMAKVNHEKIKRLISAYFTKLKGIKIQLTGKDLLEMGLTPGPSFSSIFDRLLAAKLNNMVKTREDEIDFIEKNYLSPDTLSNNSTRSSTT